MCPRLSSSWKTRSAATVRAEVASALENPPTGHAWSGCTWLAADAKADLCDHPANIINYAANTIICNA
jgi:hypothetical protein